MVGNDLVDLEQAALESNWQRKGYLNKICTPEEQQLILNAADPAEMLWLLWTMKESAYKIASQITKQRFYAPLKFSCSGLAIKGRNGYGEVHYLDYVFFTRTVIRTKLIHSTAVLKTSDFAAVQVRYLRNSPSYLQEFNASGLSCLLIKNKAGIPHMVHKTTGLQYAASVSHHGRYLAVIYADSLRLTN